MLHALPHPVPPELLPDPLPLPLPPPLLPPLLLVLPPPELEVDPPLPPLLVDPPLPPPLDPLLPPPLLLPEDPLPDPEPPPPLDPVASADASPLPRVSVAPPQSRATHAAVSATSAPYHLRSFIVFLLVVSHCAGQVSWFDVGVKQESTVTEPADAQQIWPWSQHVTPQQSCIALQAMPPVHGGVTQWPPTHACLATSHCVLQSPQ